MRQKRENEPPNDPRFVALQPKTGLVEQPKGYVDRFGSCSLSRVEVGEEHPIFAEETY